MRAFLFLATCLSLSSCVPKQEHESVVADYEERLQSCRAELGERSQDALDAYFKLDRYESEFGDIDSNLFLDVKDGKGFVSQYCQRQAPDYRIKIDSPRRIRRDKIEYRLRWPNILGKSNVAFYTVTALPGDRFNVEYSSGVVVMNY